ncbi:MAG TPA: hypothetical protein VF731_06385 [Solirubrobacterales bacterium]
MRPKLPWALCGLTALSAGLMIATTASAVSASVSGWPKTQLVSRANGSEGPPGNLPSSDPTATANGRFIFFTSYATNFTPSRPARGLRLFRRDMRTDQTTLVPTIGYNPRNPAVSANGRSLAYVSTLNPRSHHARDEIYVHDLRTGTTRLASRAGGLHGAPANVPPPHELHPSVDRPSLSANGRFLAFVSSSPNLYPGRSRDRIPPEIYLRDLKTGTTTLVSRANGPRGEVANRGCGEPEISADGRHVVFTCSSTNLGRTGPPGPVFSGNVYLRDLTAHKTIVVSRHSVRSRFYAPVISANGQFVAFFREGPHLEQVLERDLSTAKTTLVSRASGAKGEAANAFTSQSFLGISGDGSLVAFFSDATNLGGPPLPGGSAGNFGLYLRDLRTNETTFVHWEGFGKPRIVGRGRYLVFGTFNTDQPTPNGAYAIGDVYRYDWGPAGY